MTDTQVRFLRAIAAQVPPDRVVEVHLFPALRQGPIETGVAVVAEADPAGAEGAKHVVYSARYRHTIKGPDRGKWEADVVAEADAPLVTVEAVVRGVRQRAGEAAEPERLDGEAFRAAVADEPWTSAP
ncbi:MAG: hypothetical protein MUF53_07555 [Gemmatimonadaceae bacterium]|nr:hypothetical protein [Gemmatimonadaceae bacterium]